MLKKAFNFGFNKSLRKVAENPNHGGTRVDDVPEEQRRPEGDYDDEEFQPDLTPREMLELGIFGGKYFDEKPEDLPSEWWENVDRPEGDPDPSRNYFDEDASQPMEVWKEKGWINENADPKGWFQWYSRYHQGRRLPEEDKRQISRWKQMKRHKAQVEKNCDPGDEECRKRQRQALLHWGYDSRNI